jgi:hypothetical protein
MAGAHRLPSAFAPVRASFCGVIAAIPMSAVRLAVDMVTVAWREPTNGSFRGGLTLTKVYGEMDASYRC